MAKCSFCSAPLPKSGITCNYCGSRNDIDLGHTKKFVNLRPDQMRICPICKEQLQTINVGEKLPLYIERCKSCYGIFFDIGELESMIEHSVKGSRNVDLVKLAHLSENPRYVDIVTYRKCPVCQETMQRKNFMKRSGVITDVCFEHGIWLDSGELRHIMEWVKTGGIEKIKQAKLFEKEKENPKKSVNKKYAKAKMRDESSKKEHQLEDVFDILEDFFFSARW